MRITSTLLLGLSFAPPALAQEGLDAHGFAINPHDGDPRDGLLLTRAGAMSQGEWWFGGAFEYARRPLVQAITSERGGVSGQRIPIDNLLALNLSTGVAVHDYVRLDASWVAYGLSTSPEDGLLGPTVGDPRVGVTAQIVRPDCVKDCGGGLGLAARLYTIVPVGNSTRFLGTDGVGGGGAFLATYELTRFHFSGELGMQFNPAVDVGNLNNADQITAGVGVGVLASEFVGINLEALMKPGLAKPEIKGLGVPAEAVLSVRYKSRQHDFWTFGLAGGLSEAPGTAQFRGFIGFGMGTLHPPRDPDTDPLGSFVIADLCPTEAENVNGWQDGDGCPDQTGTLQVRVLHGGKMYPGATMEITGPDQKLKGTSGTVPLELGVMPESQWRVTASSDDCLAGEGLGVGVEGPSELRVELQQVLDAKVLVEVVDENDNALDTAKVVWRSDRALCVPPEAVGVDGRGWARSKIGRGTHTVLVTAPGFVNHEEEVTFVSGDDKRIVVKLAAIKVVIPKGPSKVVVTKAEIQILDKVQFETAKAVIKPDSYGLLDEVATVILDNPDIRLIEVQGHTDTRGSDSYNLDLSQRRAEAVRAYLIGRGVAPERLLSKGYGETMPLDPAENEAAWELNRRVQFKIVPSEPVPELPAEAPPEPTGAPAPEGDVE